ncbi:hypothetical protein FG386_003284 [Cryptosporidium ryanae]|uniref:uncharacterized protein n=1 Tax=Cryptosporidium ryanae TaxID=515981 RepID=UPI00351A92A7|nr:hypothetical protein FG386_003284 [Cryptosporidium ryanae]
MSFNIRDNIFEEGEYMRISPLNSSKEGKERKMNKDKNNVKSKNNHKREDGVYSIFEYNVRDEGDWEYKKDEKKGNVCKMNVEKRGNRTNNINDHDNDNYYCGDYRDHHCCFSCKSGSGNCGKCGIIGCKHEKCIKNADIEYDIGKLRFGRSKDNLNCKYYGLRKLFASMMSLRSESKQNSSISRNSNNMSNSEYESPDIRQNKSYEYEYYNFDEQSSVNNDSYNYGLEIDGQDLRQGGKGKMENFERILVNMEEKDHYITNDEYLIQNYDKVRPRLDFEELDLDENHRGDSEMRYELFKSKEMESSKREYIRLMKRRENEDNSCLDYKHNSKNLNTRRPNWVEKYSQKQRKIPVVCIKDGVITQDYMQTAELLRKVHMHNEKQILEEKATGALTLRDLRQVVGLHGFERPSIEIRRNCILVNMPNVRCLILHDKVYYLPKKPISVINVNNSAENERYTKCNITDYHDHCVIEKLVFVTYNHTFDGKVDNNYSENGKDPNNRDFNSDLDSNMRDNKDKDQYKAPLELNALEVCLVQVCTQLWDNYYKIYGTAQHFLTHIENNPTSTQKVYEINDLRKRLDSLRDRIKGVYEAIKEILDDDDLLVRIEISKFWKKPQNWDNIAILESSFFDSEILLECYEQEVEGLIKTVNRLNAQLDDAIEVMQIHLATIRNNFLKGEISLDIVGVCVGFVSAIASIFGMNIQSGLEKNIGIFWFMAYTMITMCGFAGIIVILMFRRLQL